MLFFGVRTYTADLPGGTATTTIQMQAGQTLKNALVSLVATAAAKLELSRSSASQIGTAQPTPDVIFRLTGSGTAGVATWVNVALSEKVKPFENLYVHQTGAGLGSITLS